MGYYCNYKGRKVCVDFEIGFKMDDETRDLIINRDSEFLSWLEQLAIDAPMLHAMHNLIQGDPIKDNSSRYGRSELYKNYTLDQFEWGRSNGFLTNEVADGLSRLWREEELLQKSKQEKKKPASANKSSSQNRPGWVYIIQGAKNYFKIGRARNLKSRIDRLEVKLPFPITPIHSIPTNDCVKLEAELHRLFAHLRGDGEWFDLTNGALMFIKGISRVTYHMEPQRISSDV